MTTYDLTKLMDELFKDENGHVNAEQVELTKKQLKEYGPFYLDVLNTIVEGRTVLIVKDKLERLQESLRSVGQNYPADELQAVIDHLEFENEQIERKLGGKSV